MTPARISVVGSPGSGKSTFGAALARRLDIPHVELDALHWGPGWQPTPRDELLRKLAPHLAGERWVVDGNYGSLAQHEVWQRADTVVWLDLRRPVVMRSVAGRTLKRMTLRTELWNGNRERFTNLFTRDPDKNLIVWTWRHYDSYAARYREAMSDPRWDHLTFVRLRSRPDMRAYLGSVVLKPR